jgi:anti-sigma-K factor RskA
VTDPFVYDDAAYVLGALSDAERREFEAHLETCPDCAARVAELRGLPELLAGLTDEAFRTEAEPVPDTVLPRLLHAVRRERRRRRGVISALGALAAACIVTLTLIVAQPGAKPTPPQGQAMSAVVANPVQATALVTDVAWGTRIQLTCRYGSSYEPEREYSLVVVDKKGNPHPAGSWRLVPGRPTTFIGGTALKRDEIASVQITLADHPVLQLSI